MKYSVQQYKRIPDELIEYELVEIFNTTPIYPNPEDNSMLWYKIGNEENISSLVSISQHDNIFSIYISFKKQNIVEINTFCITSIETFQDNKMSYLKLVDIKNNWYKFYTKPHIKIESSILNN